MKIADVKVTRYRNTKGMADFNVGSEALIVDVLTDQGLSGRGFMRAGISRYGGLGDVAATLISRNLKNMVVGQDPLLTEKVWESMYRGYAGVSHIGRRGLITQCMAAIDTAMWDLKGKAMGVPVASLLGGRKECIPTYANTAHQLPVNELAAMAAKYAKNGHRAVKIRGSSTAVSLDEATARVKAVREAVGPDVKLMVDVNGTWDVDTAIQMLKRWERYDIYWLEEPVPPEDIPGYVAVKARAGKTYIVGGEQHVGVFEFRELLENKAVDIVQPDAHTTGGLTEWLKIYNLATAFNVPVSPHALQVIHLHPAAALSNAMWIEYFMADNPLDDFLGHLFKGPKIREMTNENGVFLLPPDAPGFGIELDEAFAERTRVKD